MWIQLFLVFVIAVISPYIYSIVKLLGFHKVVYQHNPGPCRVLEGVDYGSEDIQTLPNGLAFITSGLRFGSAHRLPAFANVKGKIFLFDFNKPRENPVQLNINGNKEIFENLNPHGLSLWQDTTGKVLLFVVNHNYSSDGVAQDTVEKFEFDTEKRSLNHVRTFKNNAMRHLNDLVVIGPDSFYATNCQYILTQTWTMAELLLGLKWASVIYVDGEDGRIVVDGLVGPNGINVAPNGRQVYVAHMASQGILVFNRQSDNGLTLKQEFPVYTALDNIDVDPQSGDLWLGCHPIGWKTIKYLDDPTFPAPSQVLRLKVKDGTITDTQEVYAEDGHMLYGSTVATYHQGAMLIGTVAHKLAYCQVPYLD